MAIRFDPILNRLLMKYVKTSGDTMTGALTLFGDPTELLHAATKQYVDEAVTALGARYYMLDTDSGEADYKLTSTTPSIGAEQSVSKTGLADDDYIAGWISPNTGEPDKLIAGVYDWNIYAEKTDGQQTLRLYWQLVERKSDDSEVVIGTSVVSNEITTGKNSFSIPLVISADHEIASDSYVVGKIYANVSGNGNAPAVTLYYQGNSNSHWEIPANTEIFNDIYVNVTGDIMTGNLQMVDLILSGGNIYPTIDSTTAIQINKADGTTSVLNVDTVNRRIGIGNKAPSEALHVTGNILAQLSVGGLVKMQSSQFNFYVQRAGNNSSGPAYKVVKSRGTTGTPTIVQLDDYFGQFDFMGYDGNTFRIGARLVARVDSTPGSGDMPGRISLMTTPDGSYTPQERLKIHSDGRAVLDNFDSNSVGLTIQGAVSQVANLQEWLDSNTNVLAYVDKDGNISGSGFKVGATAGVDGSFTSSDGKTITVSKGIITNIA